MQLIINHIDEQIWRKSYVVFRNYLLNVYIFNSFLYPNINFESMHAYSI